MVLTEFFSQLFGCPRTNFRSLTRRLLYSTVGNHCVFSNSTRRSAAALSKTFMSILWDTFISVATTCIPTKFRN